MRVPPRSEPRADRAAPPPPQRSLPSRTKAWQKKSASLRPNSPLPPHRRSLACLGLCRVQINQNHASHTTKKRGFRLFPSTRKLGVPSRPSSLSPCQPGGAPPSAQSALEPGGVAACVWQQPYAPRGDAPWRPAPSSHGSPRHSTLHPQARLTSSLLEFPPFVSLFAAIAAMTPRTRSRTF